MCLGRYRHSEGGEYEVVLVARYVEIEEPLVVCQAPRGGALTSGPLARRLHLARLPRRVRRGQIREDGRCRRPTLGFPRGN
ncbi:DUF1653 domain-containing protein [Curtobacterium sp. ER1/6]|uniref:DUF1653 domain-containing protein n=1 Tax=Curtobacterium sp. ER1/6 TaxID=1891920 RepID=UPI00398315E1